MSSPENEVNELESEKSENKTERLADSPEEESIEDMQERMAAEAETMRKQMEEFANPDSVVEEVSHDVDLPKEVAEEEAKVMGLEEKLEEINTEAKEAEVELAGVASVEKSEDQLKLEELEAELEKLGQPDYENVRKIEALRERIETIKKDKGYAKELAQNHDQGNNKRLLSALMPDKETGLRNLNKMLVAATDRQDKERIQDFINKVQSRTDQEIKDASQNLMYAWGGMHATSLRTNNFQEKDFGTVTESQRVKDAVSSREAALKDYTVIMEKIAKDPEISELNRQIDELGKEREAAAPAMQKLREQIGYLEDKIKGERKVAA